MSQKTSLLEMSMLPVKKHSNNNKHNKQLSLFRTLIQKKLSISNLRNLINDLYNKSASEISGDCNQSLKIKYLANCTQNVIHKLADLTKITSDNSISTKTTQYARIHILFNKLDTCMGSTTESLINDITNLIHHIIINLSYILSTDQVKQILNDYSDNTSTMTKCEDDEITDICAVCQESPDEYYELKPCLHIICIQCYTDWKSTNSYKGTCMLCRQRITGKVVSQSVSFWKQYIAMQNRTNKSNMHLSVIKNQHQILKQIKLQQNQPYIVDLTHD